MATRVEQIPPRPVYAGRIGACRLSIEYIATCDLCSWSLRMPSKAVADIAARLHQSHSHASHR